MPMQISLARVTASIKTSPFAGIVALHLELLPIDHCRKEADIILGNIPGELHPALMQAEPASWVADPTGVRRACVSAMRSLAVLPASTPSLRLLADRTADAMIGVWRAVDGLLLLADPARSITAPRSARLRVPDWLPPLVNAMRVFVTIGAVELFWITTAWPNGAQAITYAAIAIILYSPRGDQAYTATMEFATGVCLTAVAAAIINFAVLPRLDTFVGFSLAIGLVLIPGGVLMSQRWHTATFAAMAVFFMPLLAPTNQMSYDTQQFYNSTLGIVAGLDAAALYSTLA